MSTNLPILNYDFALNQLGGNEALLSKMLGRFVDEFANVPAEIISLVQAHDIKNAKMKVHTVKGISGNIGLQALFDCATRFDVELRSGEASAAILEEFSKLIDNACLEIQQMEHKEPPELQLTVSTLPPEKCKSDLIVRLKRNEFIDDDTLLNLIAGLRLTESDAKHLIQLIEELQYPQAITKIEENT
jgi:HPt (histidine-containing phosphotransfer) domain-containing protein